VRLIELGERSCEVLYNTGLMHEKAGQLDKAVRLYRDALAQQPDMPEALSTWAAFWNPTANPRKPALAGAKRSKSSPPGARLLRPVDGLGVRGANAAPYPTRRGAGVSPAMPVFLPAFPRRTSARTPTGQPKRSLHVSSEGTFLAPHYTSGTRVRQTFCNYRGRPSVNRKLVFRFRRRHVQARMASKSGSRKNVQQNVQQIDVGRVPGCILASTRAPGIEGMPG